MMTGEYIYILNVRVKEKMKVNIFLDIQKGTRRDIYYYIQVTISSASGLILDRIYRPA